MNRCEVHIISDDITLLCKRKTNDQKNHVYHIMESDGDDEVIVIKEEVLKILSAIEEFEEQK